jgi:hypothetical protein
MVSRNALIIVLVIVVIGFLPLAYFFQPDPNQNQEPDTNPSNPINNQPLQTVKTYSAILQGKIVEKEGLIVARAVSSNPDLDQVNQTLFSIPEVKDALLNKTQSASQEGVYFYDMRVSVDANSTEKADYFIEKKLSEIGVLLTGASGAFRGVPVKVEFSSPANMTRTNTGQTEEIEVPSPVDGVVYPFTSEGETTSFNLTLNFVGGELYRPVAIEQPRPRVLPQETETTTENATVLNVTGGKLVSETPYDFSLSKTGIDELEKTFLEEGVNASVSFASPQDYFFVDSNVSSELVQELNASGFKVSEKDGRVKVTVKDSLEKTVNAVKQADPNAVFETPKGKLTVLSSDAFEPVMDFVPGNVSSISSTGSYEVESIEKTFEGELPTGAAQGDQITVNVTVTTLFGDLVDAKAEIV